MQTRKRNEIAPELRLNCIVLLFCYLMVRKALEKYLVRDIQVFFGCVLYALYVTFALKLSGIVVN